MKKYIARIVVMLLIASVLPLQVSAAEKESIELAVEAEQVGVSLTLPQSVSGNILSLQVGLKVDSNVQEETTATFQFSENVAKVADYRYNQEKGILNIYLSGTKTLFQNGTESLKLGNVQINTTNENGATVHVSVVEDSVKMVKGTKTEVIQKHRLSGKKQRLSWAMVVIRITEVIRTMVATRITEMLRIRQSFSR